MKKRTMLIVAIGAVALLIGLPYLVYATDYVGEFQVDVQFDISSPVTVYSATVTEVQIESTPMDTMSMWDVLLRGHPPYDEAANYTVFVSLNQTGDISTQTSMLLIPYQETVTMSFTFNEVQPGEATVRIYVQHTYIQTITFDKSYDVVIG